MESIIYSHNRIIKAEEKNLDDVIRVTREAFALYQQELGKTTKTTPALLETKDAVLNDILKNNVIIAEENGKIVGSIRFEMLSPDIAYIYRFGVLNDSSNSGTGTKLLDATVNECIAKGAGIIALHSNAKYYKLARYYYGKEFFVYSTSASKGYIRALFIKELTKRVEDIDLTPAFML